MALMLLFYIGEERYACDCEQVVAIVPRLMLRKVTQAPDYISGLLNYGGSLLPVVDFAQLTTGHPCSQSMSTRIILVRSSAPGGELLGLMAERVTQTIDQKYEDFAKSTIAFGQATYLGGILADAHGVIQLVLIDPLFEMINRVFRSV